MKWAFIFYNVSSLAFHKTHATYFFPGYGYKPNPYFLQCFFQSHDFHPLSSVSLYVTACRVPTAALPQLCFLQAQHQSKGVFHKYLLQAEQHWKIPLHFISTSWSSPFKSTWYSWLFAHRMQRQKGNHFKQAQARALWFSHFKHKVYALKAKKVHSTIKGPPKRPWVCHKALLWVNDLSFLGGEGRGLGY